MIDFESFGRSTVLIPQVYNMQYTIIYYTAICICIIRILIGIIVYREWRVSMTYKNSRLHVHWNDEIIWNDIRYSYLYITYYIILYYIRRPLYIHNIMQSVDAVIHWPIEITHKKSYNMQFCRIRQSINSY